MLDRLRVTCKKWFWYTYDYLGTLIVVNVLWILCALPVITLPVSMAGLFHVTTRIATMQEIGIRDFFTGVRLYTWRSVRLCIVYAVCLTLLAVNIMFYVRMIEQWSWIAAVLAGGLFWLMIFVLVTGLMTFPLLMESNDPLKLVIRKGVLLVIDNIGETAMLFVGFLTVLLIGAATGAGLIFGAVSVAGMLCSTGLRELQKKYVDTVDEDPEEVRGWRDLFRPWDYGK